MQVNATTFLIQILLHIIVSMQVPQLNLTQCKLMQLRNSAQLKKLIQLLEAHPCSQTPLFTCTTASYMSTWVFASQRQCRLLWESNRNRRHFVLYQVTQICPIVTFTVACSISKFINNLMILLPAGRKTLNSICANMAYFPHYIGSISSHRKQMEFFWGKEIQHNNLLQ